MIKALIFDMGGVLVDLDIEDCKKVFKEKLGYYDIDQIIDACHQKGIYGDLEEGTLSADEFRAIVLAGSRPGAAASEVDEAMSHILVGIEPSKVQLLKELSEKLAESNPLKYDVENPVAFYSYKIKHLLTSTALGMMPATAWSGRFDANGGYLVVKKDGEILCYHFYDRNRFEDYLFSNAYLERSSTTRHEYASIIKETDGSLSFKLNFQVRLK